jgi:hypothetical protein
MRVRTLRARISTGGLSSREGLLLPQFQIPQVAGSNDEINVVETIQGKRECSIGHGGSRRVKV